MPTHLSPAPPSPSASMMSDRSSYSHSIRSIFSMIGTKGGGGSSAISRSLSHRWRHFTRSRGLSVLSLTLPNVDVLRWVDPATLLGGWGALFKNEKATDETYELSRPVFDEVLREFPDLDSKELLRRIMEGKGRGEACSDGAVSVSQRSRGRGGAQVRPSSPSLSESISEIERGGDWGGGRRHSRVFGSENGDELGDSLEVPEAAIEELKLDLFLSHSWHGRWAGRVPKFIALGVYFNLHLGFLLVFLLSLLIILPSIWVHLEGGGEGLNLLLPLADLLPLLALLSFFVAISFGQRLKKMLRVSWNFFTSCSSEVRGVRVFMDKCCVHQTDPIKKREGIEALGGIILRSDVFVILWTPSYFKRLWCAYEVACFFKQHQDATPLPSLSSPPLRSSSISLPEDLKSNLHFSHVGLSAVMLGMFSLNTLVLWVKSSIPLLHLPPLAESSIQYSLVILGGVILAPFALNFASDQRNLECQIKNFELQNAECSEFRDKSLILGSIEKWYGTQKNFENFIKEQLSGLVNLLARDVPLRFLFLVSLPGLMRGIGEFFDSLGSCENVGGGVLVLLAHLLSSFLLDSALVYAVLDFGRVWKPFFSGFFKDFPFLLLVILCFWSHSEVVERLRRGERGGEWGGEWGAVVGCTLTYLVGRSNWVVKKVKKVIKSKKGLFRRTRENKTENVGI